MVLEVAVLRLELTCPPSASTKKTRFVYFHHEATRRSERTLTVATLCRCHMATLNSMAISSERVNIRLTHLFPLSALSALMLHL